MHESTVAKRYASALAELAVEKENLEKVQADLNGFFAVVDTTPTLLALLASPSAHAEEQHKAIDLFLSHAQADPITASFLKLLVDKRRMALIGSIVAAFNQDVEVRSGRVTVNITTPMPIDDAQKDQLREAMINITGRDVRLNITENPNLLGGLVFKMGSTMIDCSVRGHLTRLKAQMRG